MGRQRFTVETIVRKSSRSEPLWLRHLWASSLAYR